MIELLVVGLILFVCLASPGGAEPIKACPGPIWLGDQYILWCNGCGLRDVDDEWSEDAHANTEYECLPNDGTRCVWKQHAGRPCAELPE